MGRREGVTIPPELVYMCDTRLMTKSNACSACNDATLPQISISRVSRYADCPKTIEEVEKVYDGKERPGYSI